MKSWGTFAIVTIAVLSGFASGYALAHRQLTHDFEVKVDTEIEEMRQYMSAKYGIKDLYEESQEEEDSEEATPTNPIEAELADLKKKRKEPKIGDIELEDYTTYERYFSNGTPDTGEEGEHIDMSEGNTPTKRVVKTVSSDNYEVLEFEAFNEHLYDTTLHFTYYYDEELLVDFWGNQIEDDDRVEYIGDIQFDRPHESEDESDLYILNHLSMLGVHVNISVFPVPDKVYERHETFIKNRFSERNKDVGGE